jgi:hypothetical protein
MRSLTIFSAIALSTCFITGCDGKTLNCNDQSIADILGQSVKEEITKTLINLGTSRIGGPVSSPEEIQLALVQITPQLVSTRTTGSDKQSNKSFCAGKLSFKVSESLIVSARKGVDLNNPDSAKNMLLTGMWLTGSNGDWNAYAAKSGLRISENLFGQELTYTAQPTDDGNQIYVEFAPTTQIQNFLSQLSSAAIIGSRPAPTAAQPSVPEGDDTPLSSCAEAKLKAYKKDQGDDAPVMEDYYSEWERQCREGQ